MRITIVLASVVLAAALSHGETAKPKHYVCPPCGLPCDAEVSDKPGSCPKCGMALIDQDEAKAQAAAKKKVGILIFNGVQIIDYTGPYEIFQGAGFDVYTVAETKDPITTVAGMTVVPKYTFADAPLPEILVVPGGGVAGTLGNAATLKWVKETTAKTQHTMSVCNGAFILAKAGLLDGLTATTTHGNVSRLAAEYPKTKVVDDQRFVDNGKIITTGGLTAGIDGALHVVALTLGKGQAQQVALGEEYDWRADGGLARGTLADTQIETWIDASLDGTGDWEIVSTQGGTDRWEVVAKGTSRLSAAELSDHFGKVCTKEGKWTSVPGSTSRWKFTGRDGKPWGGTLLVESLPGAAGKYSVKLTIVREG
ncbi:MAG TPA: DJ-1/PfpI family protein [Candidatus Polarisedimenticolaceae bacterium]|nr:DJ-1/PfpI family protein [Candidatus Polarisedimenticolaceae bacterium]